MIVTTPSGTVDGLQSGGLYQFRGIPYAAPPVGRNRLKPPVPVSPWSGVRSCKEYGHAAPQIPVPGLTYFQEGETFDEDCLYLNITVPSTAVPKNENSLPVKDSRQSPATEEPQDLLPVLFWVHGGAFQKGSANMGIDPVAFAREGLVVVAANYRLGALGFLDFSGYLGEEYCQSGNNGLLDIIEALNWTKQNIAAFGGNPDNITIMGQSAGAKLCATLTLMPKARGLFRRAVLCSGAAQCIRDRVTAQQITHRFMKDAGLTKDTAPQLLDLPWETILKAQQNLFTGLNLHTVGPVFDGINFPSDDALKLIIDGACRDIGILLGTNRDEMSLYWHIYHFHDLTLSHAYRLFGENAQQVLQDYAKIPKDDSFQDNFIHLLSEYIYRAPAVRMAQACAGAGQNVFLYRLDWDRQPYKACHTSETQFLMGHDTNLPGLDSSAEHHRLSERMHAAFINFIKTGRPDADTLPLWPAYDTERQRMMVFNETCRIIRTPEPETPYDMPFQIFKLTARE